MCGQRPLVAVADSVGKVAVQNEQAAGAELFCSMVMHWCILQCMMLISSGIMKKAR